MKKIFFAYTPKSVLNVYWIGSVRIKLIVIRLINRLKSNKKRRQAYLFFEKFYLENNPDNLPKEK